MKTLMLSFCFIVLYGSGFVATQYGMPHTDPVSFLVLRFAITTAVLAMVCLVVKPAFPTTLKEWIHIAIAGTLIIGVFSLGVFVAIANEISASTSALIISFQPLLSSLIAYLFFKERITKAQWLGLIIGLVGVLAIVFFGLKKPSLFGLIMAILGLLGVACGSIYQKYFCKDMNRLSGGLIQSFASCVFCALIWLVYPTHFVEWHPDFIFALLWMAIGVSVGAFSLLYLLIQQLPISKISTLFYLVPISALFLSVMFLDGNITLFQSVGIVLVSVSIFLVTLFDQRIAKNQIAK